MTILIVLIFLFEKKIQTYSVKNGSKSLQLG